jgi:WS/DGAT/MGAT family acyltransferase
MATHPMNPVDAAWYHLDGPANPAVVNALVTTEKPLAFKKIRKLLEQRLLRFDRFRQRVVEPVLGLGTPHWEDVEDLDIDAHVHHLAVPQPGDDAALRELVAAVASAPLPHDRPLWQAYVLDGVGAGGALLMRYHHCIGDGLAMMTVASVLFDRTARPTGPLSASGMPESAWPAPSLLQTAFEVARHPQQLLDAAGLLAQGGQVLLNDLLKPGDPVSPFKGEFSAPQRVAWSAPIALEALKAVAWPFNAKINDVMVAALSGALRSYLNHRGVAGHHDSLRAMVPVNLRPPERAHALGNEFGLVILELPVAERDPLRRVARTKERMDALKHSPEAVAMEWLFNLFGRGPKVVEDLAQTLFGSKASLVLTNVAGPQSKLYLAGAAVDGLVFWVPHPGNELGMGLSLMSYRGQVRLGVIADARLVPDPEAITSAFEAEVDQLISLHAKAAAGRAAMRRRASV